MCPPPFTVGREARLKQSVTDKALLLDALIVTDCFVVTFLAMTALIGHILASAHFQFSIFNFQLIKDCFGRASLAMTALAL
jgi:hypothetical protein